MEGGVWGELFVDYEWLWVFGVFDDVGECFLFDIVYCGVYLVYVCGVGGGWGDGGGCGDVGFDYVFVCGFVVCCVW